MASDRNADRTARGRTHLSPPELAAKWGVSPDQVQWCIKHGYLSGNPIENITRVDESKKKRVRRGLGLEQLRRLLEVAEGRWLAYLAAMKTGLRRDELEKLQWGDVKLDDARPRIVFRGTANKARREDGIPLDAELAECLVAARPADGQGSDPVFPKVPSLKRYKSDLKKAGMPYKDDQGRQADFHALRMSYNMLLAKEAVPVRVAMALMRHTDIKLTAKVYSDPTMLDLDGEVGKLPRLARGKTNDGSDPRAE